MTLAVLTTLATTLAGLCAVLLIPFLARRGSAVRGVFYGMIAAIFCFSFGRLLFGTLGASVTGLEGPGGTLLTGGFPLRPLDLAIFAACLALAGVLALSRRRARA